MLDTEEGPRRSRRGWARCELCGRWEQAGAFWAVPHTPGGVRLYGRRVCACEACLVAARAGLLVGGGRCYRFAWRWVRVRRPYDGRWTLRRELERPRRVVPA